MQLTHLKKKKKTKLTIIVQSKLNLKNCKLGKKQIKSKKNSNRKN